MKKLDTLFVYGTLHPDRAPAEIAEVVKRLELIGKGTIRAHLHHFREYPAVKLDPQAPEVSGHVFRLADERDLKPLDAYEGYYPADAASSLFCRKPVEVCVQDGSTLTCWVYEYNGALPSR